MKGLYVHIPFCMQKCRYCDFTSFPHQEQYHQQYIEMLCREMETYRGESIDTVFIGGGTPTTLDNRLIQTLLYNIHHMFVLAPDCEFSIEVNPKTADKEKIALLYREGVNRVSIGVQSFHDDELSMLGRIHNSKDAYNTICQFQEAGFNNINIDLMSALPGQTLEKFCQTLQSAVKCGVPHISCYSLIVEEHTPFGMLEKQGKLQLPDEETDRQMYKQAYTLLQSAGYSWYEISNFAKKGYVCRHNLKYWNCDEYIGLGISAHSYFNSVRFYNTNNLEAYLRGSFRTDNNLTLTKKDKIEEFMIMGLRLREGIHENVFYQRFGCTIQSVYGPVLEKFLSNGLLLRQNGRYLLTDEAVNVSNSVLCEFIL